MEVMLRVESIEGTRRIAAIVASLVRRGDVLLLSGDLGGGKTAFVQALAREMGVQEPVTSPTFVLAQSYAGVGLKLHHLDVYRLNRSVEILDLNLPELLSENAVTVIEWGERVIDEIQPDYLMIAFHFGEPSESEKVRRISVETIGSSWTSRRGALLHRLQGDISA
jgi:tRNA threonylcarbamoyladenosine biosynthesis protein TsaE